MQCSHAERQGAVRRRLVVLIPVAVAVAAAAALVAAGQRVVDGFIKLCLAGEQADEVKQLASLGHVQRLLARVRLQREGQRVAHAPPAVGLLQQDEAPQARLAQPVPAA